MADSAGLPGFGDAATVRTAADAATQAATELRKLYALVDSDVAGTIPDQWGGPAASALDRLWYRLATMMRGLGSPLDDWATALNQAAATMDQARQLLAEAARFRAANGLYLRPDLVVGAYNPQQPGAQALVAVGQNQVDTAKQLAERARQRIRDANQALDTAAAGATREIMQIAAAVAGGRGGRGGGRGGRTGRSGRTGSRVVTEAEMIRAIRSSPTTTIGTVAPPSTVPKGSNVGNVMHDRVESVVRQRWPGVGFSRTPNGVTGPDMPVTGRSPGTPDPGFDWVEIKPDSDSGIAEFVRNEWGKNSAWMGRGRIVTYDDLGNVKEIDFPADTR
jgi:uncharacterized protein YukE